MLTITRPEESYMFFPVVWCETFQLSTVVTFNKAPQEANYNTWACQLDAEWFNWLSETTTGVFSKMLTHPAIIIFGKCQSNADMRASSSHEQTATSCTVTVSSRGLYKGSNVSKGLIITPTNPVQQQQENTLQQTNIKSKTPKLTVLIRNTDCRFQSWFELLISVKHLIYSTSLAWFWFLWLTTSKSFVPV